jgi:hypothetical protein
VGQTLIIECRQFNGDCTFVRNDRQGSDENTGAPSVTEQNVGMISPLTERHKMAEKSQMQSKLFI